MARPLKAGPTDIVNVAPTTNATNNCFSIPVIITNRSDERPYQYYKQKSNPVISNLIYIKKESPSYHPIGRTLPNVLVVNSRSIMGKIDELKYYSNEHKIEIIIVTETWLSDNIPSEVVNISGFILIR